ncbi:MAG: adaptor protein MecA [Butyrivibrio sp.]|nr:adaptor protein MecA [Butyrivibrio sp.]
MVFKRINDDTINCIITEDDLDEQGIKLEDFFEKKKEAMDFLHGVVEKAVEEVDYKPTGSMTPMQITVLPDHTISLTLSENSDLNFTEILKNITEKAGIKLPKDFLEELGDSTEQERLLRLSEYLNGLKSFANTLKDIVSKDSSQEIIDNKEIKSHSKDKTKSQTDNEQPADSTSEDGEDNNSPDKRTKLSRLAFNEYVYRFNSMRDVIDLSSQISDNAKIDTSLYKDNSDGSYYIIFKRDNADELTFASIFTICYEYGQYITANNRKLLYIQENMDTIIENNAMARLKELN